MSQVVGTMSGYACHPGVITENAPTFHSRKCSPWGDNMTTVVIKLLRAGTGAERQCALVGRNGLRYGSGLSANPTRPWISGSSAFL